MNSILEKVIQEKRKTVDLRKKTISLDDLKKELSTSVFTMKRSLKAKLGTKKGVNIIAEIKRASPSKGVLSKNFDPVFIAEQYTASGASAISVLTEENYFLGDIKYLNIVKGVSHLPVLRKDFIVDVYQIYESLLSGADAILLIAAILDDKTSKEFLSLANELGLECLFEVHDHNELNSVLKAGADLIGINNRDLNDFTVDLNVGLELLKSVPKEKIVVIESGIKNRKDIDLYLDKGVNSFLIGETFMISKDIQSSMKELLS